MDFDFFNGFLKVLALQDIPHLPVHVHGRLRRHKPRKSWKRKVAWPSKHQSGNDSNQPEGQANSLKGVFGDGFITCVYVLFTAWLDGLGLLDLGNVFGFMIAPTIILQVFVEGKSSIKLRGSKYPALTEV